MKHEEGAGVYAPNYYQVFKCIADKCKHSCCIDWGICIDEETYAKYKQMGDILPTIKECEDGPCFALGADGRCPHLNEKGLCNIILSHGEGYLSEICENHPRFFNDINGTRMEAGLGIVCEEACRLILETESPFTFVKIEELDDEEDMEIDFDPLPQRDHILSVIEGDGSYLEKITALKTEFAISELYPADEWLDKFLSLESLDAGWKEDLQAMRGKLFRKAGGDAGQYGKYYARLLTYFVYRHVSIAESEEELRARLAFALLSVEVIRSLFEEAQTQTLETLIDLARRYSAEIEYSEENTAALVLVFA